MFKRLLGLVLACAVLAPQATPTSAFTTTDPSFRFAQALQHYVWRTTEPIARLDPSIAATRGELGAVVSRGTLSPSFTGPIGHLDVDVFRHGRRIRHIDEGDGLTTNVGAQAMANDFNWAAPSGAAINTIKLSNNHATGTGTTAAAATDIQLQTADSITPVAGTQTFVSAANSQIYKTVATLNYTGTEAVTEWGLFTNGTLSATTGTPFTAGTATTGTVTGTPLTASSSTVQGEQQFIFKDTANATPFYGLVLSNTTSAVTVPAWYKVSDGTLSASNPANADAYQIRPVMYDHKVFSAINVLNGDSIQFTYSLTIASGN